MEKDQKQLSENHLYDIPNEKCHHAILKGMLIADGYQTSNINFELQRKRAVEAQCFAAIVLRQYLSKHELTNEMAIKKLRFMEST